MALSDQPTGLYVKTRRIFQKILETIVLVIIAALAIIVVVGVTFRKFGMPLVWYDEIASIMLAWLTYYGAALAALKRGHIGFPELTRAASPNMKVVLIFIREVVVIGFMLVVAWAGWKVVMALEGFYLASLPTVPRQLTQSVIPIGAVLFIIAELLSIPDEFAAKPTAKEGELPLPAAAQDPSL